MKNIFVAIALAVIAYLLGAFYNVSFDISVWSADCRFVTLVSMVCGAVFGFSIPKHLLEK